MRAYCTLSPLPRRSKQKQPAVGAGCRKYTKNPMQSIGFLAEKEGFEVVIQRKSG